MWKGIPYIIFDFCIFQSHETTWEMKMTVERLPGHKAGEIRNNISQNNVIGILFLLFWLDYPLQHEHRSDYITQLVI